jgi:integrase
MKQACKNIPPKADLPHWMSRSFSFRTKESVMASEIKQAGKSGVWQIIKTTYRGVVIRGSLKTTDREQALERLWEVKKLIREGKYQQHKTKFEKLASDYDPKTDRDNKLRALKLHLLPVFKGKTLADCDIKAWSIKIARGNPPTTANYILRVARELGLEVPKNLPFQKQKRWDDTQILEKSQVLGVIENYVPEKYKSVCLVAAYSLLRRIDILALRKKDVNFKDGGITIIQKKTNRSVFIPMTNKLKAAFDSVKVRPLQDDGLWFPDIVPINLSQAVIRGFKNAGIDYGSFHHFRHFGACYLLNNGIPIEVVSKILGHKSIQTTQVYARVKRQTVKEAMAVFDAK